MLDRLLPIWQPHQGQNDFLAQPAKTKVLACGRRWGKTDACAAQVVLSMLSDDATQTLLLAPTLAQAQILFDRVLNLVERGTEAGLFEPGVKVRSSPHPSLRLGSHRVTARSGHIPRALRGMEATEIIVDEAAFVPEALVHEVAMPMLATTDGRLTLISTPNGRNHFYRMYELGQRGDHGVWSASAPSSQNPYVSQRFLDVTRELVSERAFAVEYEAGFEDSEGRVFRAEAIEKSLVTGWSTPMEGEVRIGVDWARYRDYTAVVAVQGHRDEARVLFADRFQGYGWGAAVEKVARLVGDYPRASVLCDSTGVGDAAIEMLQAQCANHRVDGYLFSRASKSQLIDQLAILFDRGALQMTPHTQLLRELEHFEAANGKLEAQSGYHDDLVVALALATFHLPQPYRAAIQVAKQRHFAAEPTQNHDEPL